MLGGSVRPVTSVVGRADSGGSRAKGVARLIGGTRPRRAHAHASVRVRTRVLYPFLSRDLCRGRDHVHDPVRGRMMAADRPRRMIMEARRERTVCHSTDAGSRKTTMSSEAES